MKFFSFILFLFFTSFVHAVSIIGEDDRFYTKDTPFENLFNGVVQVGGCTGHVTKDDIVVTAAHCFDHILNKDGSINDKELKAVPIKFEGTKEKFQVKEAYIHENYKGRYGTGTYPIHSINDYVFFKLNKDIPENTNKFELYDPKKHEDYDILRSDRGAVNLVGYHGDGEGKKLAEIGCKNRGMNRHHSHAFNNYDCDVIGGSSGGLFFYILENKKTKEKKLAYIGMNSYGVGDHEGRTTDLTTGKKKLGFGETYHKNIHSQADSVSVDLVNHKEYQDLYEKFKKDPSQFRGHKAATSNPSLKSSEWIKKNFVDKKNENELKDFLSQDFSLGSNFFLRKKFDELKKQGKLPKGKERIIDEYSQRTIREQKERDKNIRKFSGIIRPKQLSIEERHRRYEELKDNPNYESEIQNKDRALNKYKDLFKPCKNKESNECKKFQQSQDELSEKVCKIPEKLKKSCQKSGFEDCFKKIHTCISLNRKIQENTMADIGFIFKGKDVSGLNSERFKKTLRQCQLFNEKNFNKYLNEKKSYEDEIDQLRKKKEIAAQEVFDLKSELDRAIKASVHKSNDIQLLLNNFSINNNVNNKMTEKIYKLYSLEEDLMFNKKDKALVMFKNKPKDSQLKSCQGILKKSLIFKFETFPPTSLDLFKEDQAWSPKIIDYSMKSSRFQCLNPEKTKGFFNLESLQSQMHGKMEEKIEEKEKQIKGKIRNLKKEIRKEAYSDENLKKEFNKYESSKEKKLEELNKLNLKQIEKEKEFKIKEMELNNLEDKIQATKISKEALKMTLLLDLKKIKAPMDFLLDRYSIDQSRDPVQVKLKKFVKKYKCEPELPELPDPKNWKWNQINFSEKGSDYQKNTSPNKVNQKGIR